jgi:hypothetical protein
MYLMNIHIFMFFTFGYMLGKFAYSEMIINIKY